MMFISTISMAPTAFSLGSEDVDVTIIDTNDDNIDGVGDDLEVSVGNFPDSATLEVWLGSKKLGNIRTDSDGDAEESFTIPEIPGSSSSGTVVLVIARDEGVAASDDVTIEPKITLEDNRGKEIDDDPDTSAPTYMADESEITVIGTAFAALEDITITDDGTGVSMNVIDEGWVQSVSKGTLGNDVITTNADGSFKFSYKIDIDVLTDVVVDVDAASNSFDEATRYLALGAVTIDFTLPPFEPKEEVDVDIGDIDDLAGSQTYSLLLGSSVQSFDLNGDSGTRSFTLDDNGSGDDIVFDAPSRTGPHTLNVVLEGERESLDSTLLLVSEEGGSGDLVVIMANGNDNPTGEITNTVVVGQTVVVVAFNFESTDTLDIFMATSGNPDVTIEGDVDMDSEGAAILDGSSAFDIPSTAGGTYALWAEGGSEDVMILLTVAPSLTLDTIDGDAVDDPLKGEGAINAEVIMEARGLAATTAYVVLVNNNEVVSSVFVTDEDGEDLNVTFDFPALSSGEHTISIALATSPKSPVITYSTESVKAFPTYDVLFELEFTPDTTFVPNELVFFSWDSGDTAGADLDEIVIELDGTAILMGKINGTDFQGVSSMASVNWDDTTLSGAFIMPNGDPETIEVTITLAGTSTAGSVDRVEGTGSITSGTTTSLEREIDLLRGSLSEQVDNLSDRLATISDGVLTIDTEIGQISSDLDSVDAKLISVENGVATLETSIGTVSAAVDDIPSLMGGDVDLSSLTSLIKSSTTSLTSEVSGASQRASSSVTTSINDLRQTVQSLETKIIDSSDQAPSLEIGGDNLPNTVLATLVISIVNIILVTAVIFIIMRRS